MPSSPVIIGLLAASSKSQASCAGLLTESAASALAGKRRGLSSVPTKDGAENGLPFAVSRRLGREVRETTSPVQAISRLMPVAAHEAASRAAKSQASNGRQVAKVLTREAETCPSAVNVAGTSPIFAVEVSRRAGVEGTTISSIRVKTAAPCLAAARTSRASPTVAGTWCRASTSA